ncbi:MAG: HAD-IIIC family phosphatase [Bdellovibrionota bacterium]|nr:HAD-IIIC family phosphatase [Bdellovibrionota bacterium]
MKFLTWKDDIDEIFKVKAQTNEDSISLVLHHNEKLGYIPTLIEKFCLQRDLSINLTTREDKNTNFIISQEGEKSIATIHLPPLIEFFGSHNAYSNELHNLSGIKYSFDFQKFVAYKVAANILKYFSKGFKLIAIDGDQTLWNGIIDEDNVTYSKELGADRGYFNFQKKLKAIKTNGVFLVLLTKNSEKDIHALFQNFDFELKLSDFQFVKANFEAKAQNLYDCLQSLNLSPKDSLFLDDSIFEIEDMNLRYPDVSTLHLLRSPHEYASLLDTVDLFSTAKTKEDLSRTTLSPLNIENKVDKSDIHVQIRDIGLRDKQRFIQLANKTNQFNLNGQKLNEVHFEELLSKGYKILQASVKYHDEDYGRTGYLVFREISNEIEVHHFFVSCRVLSFGVAEELFMNLPAGKLLQINYKKTNRNYLMTNFLLERGLI